MLLLTTIVFFFRFALLFCSLMVVTLIYANGFLVPLLMLVGPTGRPSRSMAASDAAAVDAAAEDAPPMDSSAVELTTAAARV